MPVFAHACQFCARANYLEFLFIVCRQAMTPRRPLQISFCLRAILAQFPCSCNALYDSEAAEASRSFQSASDSIIYSSDTQQYLLGLLPLLPQPATSHDGHSKSLLGIVFPACEYLARTVSSERNTGSDDDLQPISIHMYQTLRKYKDLTWLSGHKLKSLVS